MADVSGKFFSAKKVRTGVSPSSPGVEQGETLPPVNPPGSDLNSVGLSMPSAFNVANSPLTSNGTIAVTGAGTTAQYVRGDGSLASFPSLTGYVPYTGATADVDLGTHDLTAERGTFANNGSSDTLTVNHTSGSGYGIEVTKGGNNEALYVNKTSGSGNAMTVVGGRTALVDLSLSSVSNATGNFLTISGGVVHQRTPSETRSDVGAQAQLNGTGFVKASGTTITYDNSTYQVTSEKGQPNGYASLDSNGKVPLTQINDALIGNVNYQGLWNASTNNPTLVNPPASGTKGYYYIVSTAGTFAGISFEVGDWIISNGTAWGKVDNTDAVSSVFGRTGNVTATNGDYNTSQVTENTNLYYTEARVSANTDVAANTAARHNAVTLGTANGLSLSTQQLSLQLATSGQNGALSSTDWNTFNNKENAITAGTTAQYFRGDKTFQTLNTAAVPESGNLYFTNARAIASVLTGYTSGAGTISAADSILSAIQKLNGNIGALTTGVSSVNGQTGVVVLTTSNIAEGTNLYYTEARVNANTNVAANTAARHAAVTLGTANGLSLSTQQLSLGLASAGVTGALSGTDWSTFNSKQQALNGTGFVKISGTTISYDNSTYLTTAAAASTYLPLAGGTMTGDVNWAQTDRGITWGFNTDAAYIKFFNTGDGDTNSRLEFATQDNNNEYFRWGHIPSGGSFYESMRLVPNGSGSAQLIVSGSIIKSGGTSSQFLKADGSVDSNTYYLASNPSAFIALTALSGTAPIQYNNTTGAISITQASGSTNGFLSSTDWNTFNNKTSNVGTVTSVAALTLGTSGTDLSSTVANGTTTPVITLNVPTASASNRGALSATDWTTFNNKQNALTNPVTGTGTAGQVAYWSSSSAITGESNLFWDATNDRLGIGTATPATRLSVSGDITLQLLGAAIRDVGNSAILSVQNTNEIWLGGGGVGYFTMFYAGGTEKMRLDASGNLGLGVTPSAWGNTSKPLQAADASFWGLSALDGYSSVGGNYFYNGNYVYIKTGQATDYYQYQGVHVWRTAPSGTAGNAISFTQAMTLFASGNLAVGPTTDNGARLQVSGGGTVLTNYNTTNSNGSANVYQQSGSTIGWIGNGSTSVIGGSTSDFGINSQSKLFLAVGGFERMSIASTGAATFSSSVTAGGDITSRTSLNAITLSNTEPYVFLVRNSGSNGIGVIRTLDGGALAFDNGATGAAQSTKMTILAGGNVGIGTASPSQKLEVSGGAIIASGFGNRAAGTGKALEIGMDGTNAVLQAYDRTANAFIPIYISSSQTIIPTGNVLIGTTTDSGFKLDVNGTGRFSGALRANAASTIYGATQDAIQTIFTLGGQNASSQAKELYFRLTAGGTPAWTFQTAAIGTDTEINIYPNGTSGLKIAYAGAATFSSSVTAVAFTASNGGDFAWGDGSTYIDGDSSNQLIRAVVNNTERMRITSTGNVLIGTTTDAGFKLDVNGTGRFSGNVTVVSSSSSTSIGTTGQIQITSSTGLAAPAGDIYLQSVIDSATPGDRGTAFVVQTGRTSGIAERFRIASTGAATFSNNVTASGTGNIVIQAISSNNFPLFQLQDNRSGGAVWNIEGGRTLGNLQFRSNIFGNTVLELASSGAATFSSSVTASSFIRSGGTSSQYLMADGSVSTLTNPVTGTGTAGQVAYWSSGSAITGESNLFWDATNDRLGIGRNNPSQRLDILGSGTVYANIENSSASIAAVITKNTSKTFSTGLVTDYWAVIDATSGSNTRLIITSGGNVLINTFTDVTDATLNVNGNIRTAAPTGGSAENWKLGNAVNGTVNANRLIRVEIAGVGYDLVARQII